MEPGESVKPPASPETMGERFHIFGIFIVRYVCQLTDPEVFKAYVNDAPRILDSDRVELIGRCRQRVARRYEPTEFQTTK